MSLWETGCRIHWFDGPLPFPQLEGMATEPGEPHRGLFQLLRSHLPGCSTATGNAAIEQLVAHGYDLYPAFPRPWSGSIAEMVGPRWYLLHAELARSGGPLMAVVSSNLGRDHSRLPQWPTVVEAALRHVREARGRLLLAENTTLHSAARAMARVAGTATVRLCEPAANASLEEWLEGLPQMVAHPAHRREFARCDSVSSGHLLGLSPLVPLPRHPPDAAPVPTDPSVGVPLRDLATVALVDRLLVVHARAGGRIARALESRLEDRSFPPGSVFLYIPPAGSDLNADLGRWLGRGAVGWYVPRRRWSAPALVRCRRLDNPEGSPAVHQLAASIPETWVEGQPDWPWLVHCTRGLPSHAHRDATAALMQDWSEGTSADGHPLVALHAICREKRIVAGNRTFRGPHRCVSFSAVPLRQLLSRRRFQPHLGRWDWEPYGLIIRRDALRELGARRVIYGDEATFRGLAADERPYFQPSGRHNQWRVELEWRFLGDLDLRCIPVDDVRLFVRTRAEAWGLARLVPWPVLWYVDR